MFNFLIALMIGLAWDFNRHGMAIAVFALAILSYLERIEKKETP